MSVIQAAREIELGKTTLGNIVENMGKDFAAQVVDIIKDGTWREQKVRWVRRIR